ncbi:hypothetical protein M3Y97_01148400 [Aphelenchoides bicaudatus]|nr:hypothetical protein M3Y97_01148400 [Aphelenchoides bicaudatus]
MKLGLEAERARTADSIAINEHSFRVGHSRESYNSTPPPSREQQGQRQTHGYVHVTQRTLVAAAGVKVRGTEMLPSIDIPNIPTVGRNNSGTTLNLSGTMSTSPPPRLMSPPIRADMFRRDPPQ